jgi:biopolymer transport protein ExbB
MLHLFQKGGPIMWPLFLTSVISLAVVFEKILFIVSTQMRRQPKVVESILAEAEEGDIQGAIQAGEESRDFVASCLVYALKNRDRSFSGALLSAANRELKKFNQGLSILDTVITLAPLLGLLSTVTGMIHAFGILGSRELDAPSVITGGIAEALIGTAFGLGIAVVALIPYNYLNARLEEARHEIEDASTRLELLLKPEKKI